MQLKNLLFEMPDALKNDRHDTGRVRPILALGFYPYRQSAGPVCVRTCRGDDGLLRAGNGLCAVSQGWGRRADYRDSSKNESPIRNHKRRSVIYNEVSMYVNAN